MAGFNYRAKYKNVSDHCVAGHVTDNISIKALPSPGCKRSLL